MPRTKQRKLAEISSELGDGDFAMDFHPRTGRPIRRSQKADSPFVDSAIAVTDEESSDDESIIAVSHHQSKKRKRSPSPPLSDDDYDFSSPSESRCESEGGSVPPRPQGMPQMSLHAPTPVTCQGTQIVIKDLMVNVPLGHTGPIVLHLTPGLGGMPPPIGPPHPSSVPIGFTRPQTSTPQPPPRSQPSRKTGFLDLPAELRNEIYRLTFVAKGRFALSRPTNFSRSAAFLRTCRQVHQEASGILYGENEFFFSRRSDRHGSFWQAEWSELGFKSIRKFLKTIGPANTAMIRHLSFQFEDATPCLNPDTMSHEDRRFVHDEALISILRHLGDYAQLQTLKLNFHGRRRVEATDERFLAYLTRIKADTVDLVRYPLTRPEIVFAMESKQAETVRKSLMKTMVRKVKLYD
ncbi:hypothetical protein KC331_g9682 [Hortaea werneckii]|uniref:F-box domain-containing protein n=1 Tax=Hortaea werneckii TaxID=91943 RepID=A0A3M7BMT4_HORWE|nr:hypothetical protein KC331_g9682 [Hortaea werneckii]KAI7712522.1 hypothetical protein KC353_g8203 [Hortaea werneckii]RMY41118.1 hypothetical protein D0865_12372 [Hortaea werneckii]